MNSYALDRIDKETLMGDVCHLDAIVDLNTYPIADPGSAQWRACVKRIRAWLADDGCSVLSGFVKPDIFDQLQDESASVAPAAYRKIETVNAYNIALDAPLPDGHPGLIQFERGNAFAARDQIPRDHIIQQLYSSPIFQSFIAACCGIPVVYPMADSLAGLVVNVLDPGRSHPWHFDTNAYTVSLLTQKADKGGTFEYCPNIRTSGDENLSAVKQVVTGDGGDLVRRLELQLGDLQLFKGRFSLHRVAPVEGGRARLTAIFAYCEQPGVNGSVSRTRQLFGRGLPAHEVAERELVRADALMD